MFHLSKEQLYLDLYDAFLIAARHKSNRGYVKKFALNLDDNLKSLCDDLYSGTYKAEPSECFLIEDPKLREVFAASFRDRIVHHLYYGYVHEMFERTFVADSYSCIKNRGVLYGIKRLQSHILKESQNYSKNCYVLKMDVKGYFMSISRDKLLNIVSSSLTKMAEHKINVHSEKLWKDVFDLDFVRWLSKEIITLDPTVNCIIKGSRLRWKDLPDSKSLFKSAKGVGLPIGNLTSQLFSNIYLNKFDQYMKRGLGCKHYGRYVDDFYVVSADKQFIHSIIPKIRSFLYSELGLSISEEKTVISNVFTGVDYLGGCVKPFRLVPSEKTKKGVRKKLEEIVCSVKQDERQMLSIINKAPSYEEKYNSYIWLRHCTSLRLRSQINSYYGYLSHYRCQKFIKQCTYGVLSSTIGRYGFFKGRIWKACN